MSQWITEEQTPHLRLSAEAEEVLYSGESEFQKNRSVQIKRIWYDARIRRCIPNI